MTRDRPMLPACSSRLVRPVKCVLRRGDQVLRDLLLAYPNLSPRRAIEAISEAGW
jgi:hypothetical protein